MTGIENIDEAVERSARDFPESPVPMKEVEGKVAFITGGSSGIGLGIAHACVDAGMKVVIGYQTQAHVESALSSLADTSARVHSIKVDVTDRPGMELAVQEVIRCFGKVHLLVNNAGVSEAVSLGDATYDDWDWIMGINVGGVFNCVHAFLPHIKAHGEGGHVVGVSSTWGLIINGSWGVYSASKAAIVAMMEALRGELSGANIGVSVYCPGWVNSNIAASRRNRPASLCNAAFRPNPEMLAEMREFAQQVSGLGMDPLEAGRLVLRGIRNNDLYILSHPEYEQGIRDRNEALLASIPRDLVPPESRTAIELQTLRSQTYIAERDRKLRASRPTSYLAPARIATPVTTKSPPRA